jgi:hypothetical protein
MAGWSPKSATDTRLAASPANATVAYLTFFSPPAAAGLPFDLMIAYDGRLQSITDISSLVTVLFYTGSLTGDSLLWLRLKS